MQSKPPVTQQMEATIRKWEQSADRRATFLKCYMRMTRNILGALRAGELHDADWVHRLLERFAEYCFEALDEYDGEATEAPSDVSGSGELQGKGHSRAPTAASATDAGDYDVLEEMDSIDSPPGGHPRPSRSDGPLFAACNGARLDRVQPPTPIGHEARQHHHHDVHTGVQYFAAREVPHGRADHDQRQPSRRQRG